VCREHIRRRERAREQAMIGHERRQVRAFRICLALTNSKCVSRNPTPRPVIELKRPTMETPRKTGKNEQLPLSIGAASPLDVAVQII
jgi:hypothetical protein